MKRVPPDYHISPVGMHAGDEAQSCLMTIEAEATLENCRALIKQIKARLSAKKPFVNASSAAELLLHLESAASALRKSARRP
jgi:hypothetical protein